MIMGVPGRLKTCFTLLCTIKSSSIRCNNPLDLSTSRRQNRSRLHLFQSSSVSERLAEISEWSACIVSEHLVQAKVGTQLVGTYVRSTYVPEQLITSTWYADSQ